MTYKTEMGGFSFAPWQLIDHLLELEGGLWLVYIYIYIEEFIVILFPLYNRKQTKTCDVLLYLKTGKTVPSQECWHSTSFFMCRIHIPCYSTDLILIGRCTNALFFFFSFTPSLFSFFPFFHSFNIFSPLHVKVLGGLKVQPRWLTFRYFLLQAVRFMTYNYEKIWLLYRGWL